MTKSKPNKKENKSKTSEEPTHRKPQQETIATDFQRISKIHDRVFVGVSGFATDVQKLLEWWNDFFCYEENMGGWLLVAGVVLVSRRTWLLSSKPE
ncbi:unnamed protein product [Brassica oleracea]|uniref:(rape) hypothetical protein n=1 Tax=Brassica napus TaxID=3708 RepID=A0A816KBL5_BRANA|nr:unnamed protein product [Brassica napus]